VAAVTAVEANIGRAAADALAALARRDAMDARAAAQRERQRSAPDADRAKPTLSVIDPTVWGDTVR
jgi:hypothetical protein